MRVLATVTTVVLLLGTGGCAVREQAAEDVRDAARGVEFCAALVDFREALAAEELDVAMEIAARLEDLAPVDIATAVEARIEAVRSAADGDEDALRSEAFETADEQVVAWAGENCSVRLDGV